MWTSPCLLANVAWYLRHAIHSQLARDQNCTVWSRLIGISTSTGAGIGFANPFCSMNVRPTLLCTFALLAGPLLPACGSGSSSEASSGATSGVSSGASSGTSAGASGATSGAESGATSESGSASSGTSSGSSSETSSGASSGATSGVGSGASTGASSGASSGATSDAGSGASSGTTSGDGGALATPAVKVAMYLYTGDNFDGWATKVDFTKMTHLLLAFATVQNGNSWTGLGDTAGVQALVAAAHAKNVKVLVSIGGGGGDQTVISAYQSASNIAPLVANLDTMVTAMNLDGVDVDLEDPGSMKSSSNYPALVKQLIATFHPESKLVTTASAQYIVQGQNADAIIVATLNSFDFINDMVYTANMSDFTSEAAWWTGNTIGLPKENLVWGICFGECGQAPSAATVAQITTASKAYGGIMFWEYTDTSEATLWPAAQSAL
jgi:hypothetical protein